MQNPKPFSGFQLGRPFSSGLLATLGVGLGLAIIAVITNLSLLLIYIGLAFFIALALEPLISRLTRLGLPRALAVALLLLSLCAVVALVLWLLIPILIKESVKLFGTVENFITRHEYENWLHDLRGYIPNFDFDQFIKHIWSWVQDNVSTISSSFVQLGMSLITGFTGLIIVLILTIYFLASLPAIKEAAYSFAPASKRDNIRDITEEILSSVGRYTAGQFVLASINGVLTLVLFSLLNFEYPIVMAFIAFVGSIIPLVGTISSSTIISLITLLSNGNWIWLVVIYYLIYMNLEAYVISPRIMSRAVSVPGSLVVISALAGGMLLGILGAILAVPMAASVIILVKRVILPRQSQL